MHPQPQQCSSAQCFWVMLIQSSRLQDPAQEVTDVFRHNTSDVNLMLQFKLENCPEYIIIYYNETINRDIKIQWWCSETYQDM